MFVYGSRLAAMARSNDLLWPADIARASQHRSWRAINAARIAAPVCWETHRSCGTALQKF
jgi:hypothetical protein